ncbi:MAG: hypothetical protein MUF72_02385 [Elainella sp. Prado103]|jgi:hypothetical protein|nr:hypothetical protein [Elainella sp. Prado103]
MKPRSAIVLWIGIGSSLVSGCSILRLPEPASTSPSIAAPIEVKTSPSLTASSERPDTRVMPMAIEGQVVEMELKLFDQLPLPFTTYFPVRDFQSEVSNSEQGMVAQFTFSVKGQKNEAAYVQIFLPAQRTSIEEMQGLLLDERGLLATNHWQLIDRTEIVSYPWAREKLIYQQQSGQQTYVGSIYIGDYEGRSFYALTHYPVEYMDGFEPRSTVMLENLQFRYESRS